MAILRHTVIRNGVGRAGSGSPTLSRAFQVEFDPNQAILPLEQLDKVLAVGVATEAGTGQAVTPVAGAAVVSVGQTSEAGSAQAVTGSTTGGGSSVSVGHSPRGRVLLTADLVSDGSDGLIEVGIPDDSWIRASKVDYQVTVEFSGSRQIANVGRITVGPAL